MLCVTPDLIGPALGSLSFVIEERSYETVVKVHGEIDMASAPSLTAILHRVARLDAPVRLDLSGVEFVDSSGLHAMEDADRTARRFGRPLNVGPVSGVVSRLLDLTGPRHGSAL